MEGDSLKFNFEIALEKIDTLTKHNNELLDEIDQLENRIDVLILSNSLIEPDTATTRYDNISREADKAMKRFTSKLKKEIDKNAKSKQSQGEPV
jgi:flagellar biosynthesis chaperone FliJ